LARLRTEEYQTRRRVLEDYLDRTLLSRESRERNVTLEELLKMEIDQKARPVTEAETKAVYEATRERFAGQAESQALKQIEDTMRGHRRADRRVAFLAELRLKNSVRVLLEPPRFAVDAGRGPSHGPAGAPVTVVEFSDFQCPYCATLMPSLKRLEEQYGDSVRIVFRHFPLPMHKDAFKAAEAAACADEQGRFWEMHDKLFANQQSLQTADLKALARGVGLDPEAFGRCLDAGRGRERVQEDVANGSAYGISGTPTVFVNGRLLGGAVPYELLAKVIQDEMDRGGQATARANVAQGAGRSAQR
jgi:predicted DsbA family dithiol-disulfide isomerase